MAEQIAAVNLSLVYIAWVASGAPSETGLSLSSKDGSQRIKVALASA